MDKKISLNKVYRSEDVNKPVKIEFDLNNKKRPSWVKIKLDKKIIFIKILFNGESFWYRKYFQDYFFIFDGTSEDYRNYYNKIAPDYESFVPQNKEMRKVVLNFLKELNISKNSKILDLGAGTGIVTEGIAKEGYTNLTLLDISKEELKIAKNKKSLKSSNFIEMDITKKDLKEQYDIIFETMSLDYFKGKQLPNILDKIRKALVNNGKFIVIDRHIYPEFNDFFKEIRNGKITLDTPEGKFDYYFFIGENSK